MINYTTWISLFVLSLKLFPSFNSVEDIEVKTSWKSLESMNMFANAQAMQVEFYSTELNKSLITYVLMPWDDISFADDQSDISSLLELPDLLCVSPYAIIYEQNSPDEGEHEVVLKEKITTYVAELMNVEKYSQRTEYREGFTLGDHYQVMSMRLYPYLVDMNIAIPGSAHLDPEFFKNEYSNTMIFVSMIPDMGRITASWIKAGDAEEVKSVDSIQDELIQKFEAYITFADTMKDIEKRTEFYLKSKKDLFEYLTSEGINDTNKNFYCDLLRRLLHVPDVQDNEIYIHPVFGNYQPKNTPDVVADYMPEILDDLDTIPEGKLQNLCELIDLFGKYTIKAEENPGKTVEGNILLGGLPEEYRPSKQELMLYEIGERIKDVIGYCDDNEVGEFCKEHGLCGKELEYVRFSFIHYDVMGSGRFFYVSSRETVQLRLP